MERPRICGVIVDTDLEAVARAEQFVELFEVRIDLIGDGWRELVRHLGKPWIASNRTVGEGGGWELGEAARMDRLLEAVELGADVVDVELGTESQREIVALIKRRARCLLSFHQFAGTLPLVELKEIVCEQLEAGADVCKVITTAEGFEDNLDVLQLITEFPSARVVSFAMGPVGLVSRVLCPLVGGYFTYASLEAGRESAPGQITARELRRIYQMLGNGE